MNQNEFEQAKKAFSEFAARVAEAVEIVAEQLQPLADAFAELFPTAPTDPMEQVIYNKRMRGRHYCEYVRKHNPTRAVHLKIISPQQTTITARRASQLYRKYRHQRRT